MMTNSDFELGGDRTNPKVESESVVYGSSSDSRLDSPSVCLIGSAENLTGVQGDGSVGGCVAGGSMGSVSPEGNVSDVNNRGAGDANKLGGFVYNDKDVFGDKNGSAKNEKSEQLKGHRREQGKSKESKSPVYDSMLSMFDNYAANGSVVTMVRPSTGVSPGHGFEVGDMVWGKVKSHPWWPGHVYSEEFATPSVRQSKREGLLLVAFFGDSSYGWFDPSELVPFDSNYAEKSCQTNSRTFVKAVEEAMDEVSRRSGLGLSCMCRNKQNFRQTDVQGYFAVDVAEYEPGAVYSIDTIGKARGSFRPRLALDFVRQLALEPTGSEHVGIDFIKSKATVMSYRKAVYEEFDETYAQAFGYEPVRPSPGSIQELAPGKIPYKAPLSGREVFADTLSKGKSPAKPNKPKDHKKDKYLFKRRDEFRDVKMHQKEKRKATSSPHPTRLEDHTIAAGDYMLQKRVSGRHEQIGTTVANGELALRDATGTGESMEETPIVLESDNPGFQMNMSTVELPSSFSVAEVASGYSGHLPKVRRSDDEEKRLVPKMEDIKSSSGLVVDKSSNEARVFTQDDIPSSGPHKIVASQRVFSEPKKVKVSKRPVGELGSGKSVLPEKKKKRKQESLMSDSTRIHGKEGFFLVEKVSANKPLQSALAPKPPIEDPHKTDGKATTSYSSHTAGTQEMTGLGNYEVELPQILGDLHSLALDPFHAINRGWPVKVRQVFLRFRSLVFQKSLNSSLAEGEPNDTHSSKSPAVILATGGSENGKGVPPVKPQVRSSVRPDDPTKGGRKRSPSDRQEEIAAKKKKKIGDIRNLTKERKVIKKIDESVARVDGKQAVVMTSRKSAPEFKKKTEQRASEPTMLIMKFPPGGSLPSINELKARFARYGPMDHSATRIFWNTFTCRVVYRQKSHAQAAYKFVVGSSSLFGNTDVKCSLKEVGVVGSSESEPPLQVPKEDPSSGAHQPAMEDRPSVLQALPGLQLKSCLKKSGGEEAGGNGSKGIPRVKFMLGGDESHKNNLDDKNGSSADGAASSFSSSHATMDFNSKNFHKAVVLQSSHPLPFLPLPTSTTVTSSTAQFTRPPPPPPPSSMHFGTPLAPPSLPSQPPRSMHYSSDMAPPQLLPPPPHLNRPFGATPTTLNLDISQQMLSLLTKCKDVVTNVTGLLGYVPYHPL